MKNKWTKVLFVLLTLLSIGSGILVARVVVSPFSVGEHGEAIDPPSADGRINILMVGIDEVGYNTDVIMLVNINPVQEKLNVLSIPRDTRVYVGGSYRKINSVYGYAVAKDLNREEVLINTVKALTNEQPIHYYAVFNVKAFREIVDTLGGVEYDVPRNFDYEDPYQNLSIHIEKGFQVLDGKKAEGLVRFRGDYAGGDLQRIGVQQDFIKEFLRQKLKLEYVTKIPDVYNSVTESVRSNMKIGDITDIAIAAQKIGTSMLDIQTLPGEAQYINNISYYIKNDAQTSQLLTEKFGA